MSWKNNLTREDYNRARRRAFLGQLRAIITQNPNELLPLEEIRSRLNVRGQHYLGSQTVPIDQIVGTEGRYTDFDRRFQPRHDATKFRWMSIDRAYYEDVGLPAVDLYKLSDIYFVKDGHHRISVARQRGQQEIDAIVTELLVDVPLDANLGMRDLLLKEEYSDFLAWTDLATLRPNQRIEFSEPGGYLDLVRHINAHRYYLGLNLERDVTREEAIAGWYDNVYLPVVQILQERNALRSFPGRTEADLYRWIMDHRWYLRERNGGADPGPLTSVEDYIRLFGRTSLTELTERLMNTLREAILPAVSEQR
jgi:hypothetical protein